MSYDTIEHNGQKLKTGCLVGQVRTFSASPLATAVKPYTMAEVLEIVMDPSWVDPRERFPSERWIFNQGSVGSCNFYAAKGAMMRSRAVNGHDFVELSAEFGYANTVDGRDQGSTLDASMRQIVEQGLPPMRPNHHQKYRKRDFSPEDYAAAGRFKGFELYEVANELELATAIIKNFFCDIAVHVGNNFTRIDSKGRVQGDRGAGNHAVCVHGVTSFDGKTLEFDHAGSWGTRMHQGGYGYLNWSRNWLSQTRNYHPFWAMRGVLEDGDADNPTL